MTALVRPIARAILPVLCAAMLLLIATAAQASSQDVNQVRQAITAALDIQERMNDELQRARIRLETERRKLLEIQRQNDALRDRYDELLGQLERMRFKATQTYGAGIIM